MNHVSEKDRFGFRVDDFSSLSRWDEDVCCDMHCLLSFERLYHNNDSCTLNSQSIVNLILYILRSHIHAWILIPKKAYFMLFRETLSIMLKWNIIFLFLYDVCILFTAYQHAVVNLQLKCGVLTELQCLYLLYFLQRVNLLEGKLLSDFGPAGVCGSLKFEFIELSWFAKRDYSYNSRENESYFDPI